MKREAEDIFYALEKFTAYLYEKRHEHKKVEIKEKHSHSMLIGNSVVKTARLFANYLY